MRKISHFVWDALLRPGRLTKFSPSWRGVNTFTRLYRKFLPADLTLRITDIDEDLLFDVEIRGNMGLYLWHYPNLFEKETREIFCKSIFPGCAVLDVGANIGFYTLLAAKRGARVFAIEADPINAAMLRNNVRINGFDDCVQVFEMAATDRVKAVSLYRHPFNLGESNIIANGTESCTVEGRTIDSLNLPPIDICKMDVEGAELPALHGMKQTLSRSPRMRLLVEYAKHLGAGVKLLDYLHTNFSAVEVLEKNEQLSPDHIPDFCNLLAS